MVVLKSQKFQASFFQQIAMASSAYLSVNFRCLPWLKFPPPLNLKFHRRFA